jgi:hypothetical protein
MPIALVRVSLHVRQFPPPNEVCLIRRVIPLLAATLVAIASPLAAQSNLSFASSLTPGSVSYNSFAVTTAGTFDLFTTSITGPAGTTPFDPVLYLFSGLGTGGTLLSVNDDGCNAFPAQCGPASSSYNSLLNDFALGVGTYTVAVGAYSFSESEARSGINADASGGGAYTLRVASLQEFGGGTGVAVDLKTGVVPEPATVSLVAAGLAGLLVTARRRRRQV